MNPSGKFIATMWRYGSEDKEKFDDLRSAMLASYKAMLTASGVCSQIVAPTGEVLRRDAIEEYWDNFTSDDVTDGELKSWEERCHKAEDALRKIIDYSDIDKFFEDQFNHVKAIAKEAMKK